MSLKFPLRLIEYFGRFRQMNLLVSENWRDSSAQNFFTEFVDPINNGWGKFRRDVDTALDEIKRFEREYSEVEQDIQRSLVELYHTDLCNLNGKCICRVRDDAGREQHFIADRQQCESGALESVAFGKGLDVDFDSDVTIEGVINV